MFLITSCLHDRQRHLSIFREVKTQINKHSQSKISRLHHAPLQQSHNNRRLITRDSRRRKSNFIATALLLVDEVEPTRHPHLPLPALGVRDILASLTRQVAVQPCIPYHGPAGIVVQVVAHEEIGFVVVRGEDGVGLLDLVPGFFAGGLDGAVGFGVLEVGGERFAAGPDGVEVALPCVNLWVERFGE